MVEAMLLVVLVIFLFLRSLRATLIPFVTIPVSLIGAFFFLYVLGLLHQRADAARHGARDRPGGRRRDRGAGEHLPPHRGRHAAVRRRRCTAAARSRFAVVAMTLTLAAVFAPLAFMTGNTGKLFTEFALTVAAAVLVSGFVALTLTPMMCSKMLRHQASAQRALQLRPSASSVALNNGYRRLADALRCATAGSWSWCSSLVAVAGRLPAQVARSRSSRRSRTAASSSASCSRPRARRWTTPTATRASVEEHVPGGARDPALLRGGRAGPGAARTRSTSRCRFVQLEAVGRAHAQASRQITAQLAPQDVRDHARRARLPGQSALARPELPQPAGAVRGAGATPTRSCDQLVERADGQGARLPGPRQPRQRPQAQQAAAHGRHRPRQGGATSASTSRPSAARSRRCSAGARSRASSAKASSTT